MVKKNDDSVVDQLIDEVEGLNVAHKASKKAHKRHVGKKTVKVRSSLQVALDELKTAKSEHRAEIKKLAGQIKSARRNIKMHKLLVRQAKSVYTQAKRAEKLRKLGAK